MSEKIKNMPAFPPNAGWRDDDPNARGLTLRDWFAGQAIGPLMASDGVEEQIKSKMIRIEHLPEFLAPIAYQIADAMIRAREFPEGLR